jgi:hypothetical protein
LTAEYVPEFNRARVAIEARVHDAWICQGIREPLIQSDRQDQARKFDQLGNFPERNRTDSDFVILVVFDQLRVGTVEP